MDQGVESDAREHGSRRRLSVVIPAYNEVGRVESTLQAVLDHARDSLESCEIIVVDDGSSDGTAESIRTAFGDRVRVCRHAVRQGKGAAVRSGVRVASEPWLLVMDADLPLDLAVLERFLGESARAPIVIASKRAPGQRFRTPALRRFAGWCGHLLITVFVVRGFHDTQCGFKLFETRVAKQLFGWQRVAGYGFDFEILFLARRLGHRVREIPVSGAHKARGTVQVGTYFRTLLEIAQVLRGRMAGHYPPAPGAPRMAEAEGSSAD